MFGKMANLVKTEKNTRQDDGERAVCVRTVVQMASALRGGRRGGTSDVVRSNMPLGYTFFIHAYLRRCQSIVCIIIHVEIELMTP